MNLERAAALVRSAMSHPSRSLGASARFRRTARSTARADASWRMVNPGLVSACDFLYRAASLPRMALNWAFTKGTICDDQARDHPYLASFSGLCPVGPVGRQRALLESRPARREARRGLGFADDSRREGSPDAEFGAGHPAARDSRLRLVERSPARRSPRRAGHRLPP